MKKVLFLILVLVAFTSCKKEKKILRNLYNNGGEWEIVEYQEIVTSSFELNEKTTIRENVGLFLFKPDDSGWIINSEGLDAFKADFKYQNSDNQLALVYGGVAPQIFDLEWEKNAFIITQNLVSTYSIYYPNPTGDSLTITDNTTIKYFCEKM